MSLQPILPSLASLGTSPAASNPAAPSTPSESRSSLQQVLPPLAPLGQVPATNDANSSPPATGNGNSLQPPLAPLAPLNNPPATLTGANEDVLNIFKSKVLNTIKAALESQGSDTSAGLVAGLSKGYTISNLLKSIPKDFDTLMEDRDDVSLAMPSGAPPPALVYADAGKLVSDIATAAGLFNKTAAEVGLYGRIIAHTAQDAIYDIYKLSHNFQYPGLEYPSNGTPYMAPTDLSTYQNNPTININPVPQPIPAPDNHSSAASTGAVGQSTTQSSQTLLASPTDLLDARSAVPFQAAADSSGTSSALISGFDPLSLAADLSFLSNLTASNIAGLGMQQNTPSSAGSAFDPTSQSPGILTLGRI